MQRIKITTVGYNRLKEELDTLINVERPNISRAIGEALDIGDLKENAEYSSAKDQQGIIEARIRNLTDILSHADAIDITKLSGDEINFGARVHLIDEDTEKEIVYQLVSEYESDLECGKISIESPVGKALVGKKVGDSIEIKIPNGTRNLEVLKIEWA